MIYSVIIVVDRSDICRNIKKENNRLPFRDNPSEGMIVRWRLCCPSEATYPEDVVLLYRRPWIVWEKSKGVIDANFHARPSEPTEYSIALSPIGMDNLSQRKRHSSSQALSCRSKTNWHRSPWAKPPWPLSISLTSSANNKRENSGFTEFSM